MAVSEYDKQNLSQAQQDSIASITQQAKSGEISWKDAHAQAEAIRNEAGYSGGSKGNEYIEIQNNASTANSKKENTGGDEYKQIIQDMQNWYTQQNAAQEARYAALENQIAAMNKATTDSQIASLKQQLSDSEGSYNQQRAQNAITRANNADNLSLQRAAAGEKGGIGAKQYSDAQANYDSQMYEIQLEQQNLINDINTQIIQAEANGDYETANALYELGQAKINMLQEQADTLLSFGSNAASTWLSSKETETSQALSRAYQNLQLGIFSADDAKALGVSEEDAERVANYYRTMADYDLASAQAEIAALAAEGSSTKKTGSQIRQTDVSDFADKLAGTGVEVKNRATGGTYYLYYDSTGSNLISSTGAQPNDGDYATIGGSLYVWSKAYGGFVLYTVYKANNPGYDIQQEDEVVTPSLTEKALSDLGSLEDFDAAAKKTDTSSSIIGNALSGLNSTSAIDADTIKNGSSIVTGLPDGITSASQLLYPR